MKQKITYVSLESDASMHVSYEAALSGFERNFGHRYPLYIGGKGFEPAGDFAVRSPIDRDIVIGYFQEAGENEAHAAIRVAKEAFPAWSGTDPAERIGTLRKAADLLERQLFDLAALITIEAGKTRSEAVAEVGEAVEMIRYYAAVYEKSDHFTLRMQPEAPGGVSLSTMRPHGVWAVISPFNFPLALAAGMASAALLAGNTVVMKPASATPLTGIRLYEAFVQGGVPAGAVNLVTGPGAPFGEAVTSSPDVDGIAFTGSRDVGMWLQRAFVVKQPYPKPFIAEMGSKNPCIVTDKADLEKAVEGVVRSAFGYGGQKCSATSRVYVHRDVAEAYARALVARTEELKVGDPRERDVSVGPLISEAAQKTFEDAVALALKDGGRVITGGGACSDGALKRGYYVRPTIVAGLAQDHPLMKNELFVPLLCLRTFSSLPEAVAMANDTAFGLTAGIFSEDQEEIDYFFDHIRFGVCYANRQGGATTGAWPGRQSFGGWKASGSTGRGAGGPYYLFSYLREQAQTRI
jgi:1-pyrroline-5-carboxylate dehydrogenase